MMNTMLIEVAKHVEMQMMIGARHSKQKLNR